MGCKRDVSEQIGALQSQAQSVMEDTAVLVDERIQKAVDFYKQAEALAEEGSLDDKMYESLLSDSAKFFYEYGFYKDALSRYTHLIALLESLYGKEDPITASAYHDIGEVYRNLFDLPKALDYNQRALDIRMIVFGEEHAETATSINDTGLVLLYQGDYDKALEMICKAKNIREEIVGVNHIDTAESYANIGSVNMKMEDYSTALEYYTKAVTIYERELGTEDRKTAVGYYGVGMASLFWGKAEDAVNYISKAATICEKVLGEKHPETAIIYIGRGLLFNSVNGYEKAIEYYTKSLEISIEILGEDHPNTASTYCALGWLMHGMGDSQKALEYFEKNLNITENALGLSHPDTADSYYVMGSYYSSQNDVIKSHEYYANALEIYKKCPSSEFINRKIKAMEAEIEALEVKDDEESKGTRDLFLETLTNIGCQYEIDPDDGYISFGYHGENFSTNVTNKERYVNLWDTYWGHVDLYDIDELARLKKAVNHANLNCSTITVYTTDEEKKTVNVHCKSTFPFLSQMPDLENYLRVELNDFFNAHRLVGNEMDKLREQEEDNKTN